MRIKILSPLYRKIASYVVHRQSTDLEYALQLKARDKSASYMAENMEYALRCKSREEMLKIAVHHVEAVKGCICEFGVFNGYSLRILARAAVDRHVYGFDSFKGLPEDWRPNYQKGAFKTKIPRIFEKNVELKTGLFEDTIPVFLEKLTEPIALVHVDCDLYSSTKTVLTMLSDYLADGAILVFDEYLNYPGWEQDEHRALTELRECGRIAGEYIAVNVLGEQVAFRVRK